MSPVAVDVEPALVGILRGAAGLTALLGATGGQPSIFPMGLPSGAALPAILFQQIADPVGAMGMGIDSSLHWPTYQFTVMVGQGAADAYKTMKAIVTQLRTALERVRGTYVIPEGTVTIQDILHVGGGDAQWPNLAYVGYNLDVQVICA
jgi:hypothetical protein